MEYIKQEAKEVIDLISSNEDSGQVQGLFCIELEETNIFNTFNMFQTLNLAIFMILGIMDIMGPLYTINVDWLDQFNETHYFWIM